MATDSVAARNINPKGALVAGLLIVVVAIGLIWLSLWFVSLIHQDYSAAIMDRLPIFLEREGYTVFYMAPLVFLAMLILGGACVAVGLRGEAYPKTTSAKLNKVVAPMVVAGLFGMFGGSYLANQMWAEWFDDHGYTACSGSFTITSRWFTTVWVRSPDLCSNQAVRTLFREGKPINQINAFVEASL